LCDICRGGTPDSRSHALILGPASKWTPTGLFSPAAHET
jgi:hypothetical protein